MNDQEMKALAEKRVRDRLVAAELEAMKAERAAAEAEQAAKREREAREAEAAKVEASRKAVDDRIAALQTQNAGTVAALFDGLREIEKLVLENDRLTSERDALLGTAGSRDIRGVRRELEINTFLRAAAAACLKHNQNEISLANDWLRPSALLNARVRAI